MGVFLDKPDCTFCLMETDRRSGQEMNLSRYQILSVRALSGPVVILMSRPSVKVSRAAVKPRANGQRPSGGSP